MANTNLQPDLMAPAEYYPQQVVTVPQPVAGVQAMPAPQPMTGVASMPMPQPVAHQPTTPQEVLKQEKEDEREPLELRVFSHSSLLFWWPVWAVGFLMAAATYWQSPPNPNNNSTWELVHPSSNPGIIFFFTLFAVILITNVSARGLASGMVLLSMALVTVLLAYFGVWDDLLRWLGNLKIHLNLGAYLSFSTLLFVVWALTVFVFDRMAYWRIKPGQITYEFVLGSASKSYDTDGMVLEKHRDDVFRHWLLGLGSGDLVIQTAGGYREQIDVPNVLFVGYKLDVIQRMIAVKPDAFGHATIK